MRTASWCTRLLLSVSLLLPSAAAAACANNADCKAGRVCSAGACVTPCSRDVDCAGELQCERGVCVAPSADSSAAAPAPAAEPRRALVPAASSGQAAPAASAAPEPELSRRAVAPVTAPVADGLVRLTLLKSQDDKDDRYRASVTSASGTQTCEEFPCEVRVPPGEVRLEAQGGAHLDRTIVVGARGGQAVISRASRTWKIGLGIGAIAGGVIIFGATAWATDGFTHPGGTPTNPNYTSTALGLAGSALFIGGGAVNLIRGFKDHGQVFYEEPVGAAASKPADAPPVTLIAAGVGPIPGGAAGQIALAF